MPSSNAFTRRGFVTASAGAAGAPDIPITDPVPSRVGIARRNRPQTGPDT